MELTWETSADIKIAGPTLRDSFRRRKRSAERLSRKSEIEVRRLEQEREGKGKQRRSKSSSGPWSEE